MVVGGSGGRGELFVWGIERRVRAEELQRVFERFGPVRDARIIFDTSRCRQPRDGML